MEFISREAEEREKITYELGDFIDDNTQPKEEVSFYRERDPNNIKDYKKNRYEKNIKILWSDT